MRLADYTGMFAAEGNVEYVLVLLSESSLARQQASVALLSNAVAVAAAGAGTGSTIGSLMTAARDENGLATSALVSLASRTHEMVAAGHLKSALTLLSESSPLEVRQQASTALRDNAIDVASAAGAISGLMAVKDELASSATSALVSLASRTHEIVAAGRCLQSALTLLSESSPLEVRQQASTALRDNAVMVAAAASAIRGLIAVLDRLAMNGIRSEELQRHPATAALESLASSTDAIVAADDVPSLVAMIARSSPPMVQKRALSALLGLLGMLTNSDAPGNAAKIVAVADAIPNMVNLMARGTNMSLQTYAAAALLKLVTVDVNIVDLITGNRVVFSNLLAMLQDPCNPAMATTTGIFLY